MRAKADVKANIASKAAQVLDALLLLIKTLALIICIVAPLMIGVAYTTLWERKLIGWMQIRLGPNRVGPLPKKKPTQYLKDGQLFFDTIVFTPEALRHLIAETGVGQIMIGTDYPFPWTSTEVDLVLSTPGLSDADRVAILGGTAQRLLGIK